MGRFRIYVFSAAGLVILAGAFTVIGPYVDQGQAEPPVKGVNVLNIPLPVTGILVGDVLVTNTAAEPVPVVVQNGGGPAGEKDIAIVTCASGGSGLLVNESNSAFSAGVPSLSELNHGEPCAAAIAALTKEGFELPIGGGRSDTSIFIVMTRNKLP